MKPQVHRQLRELSERTGKEYGKLVQKLLAIAFLETEAESLTECSIQGIDLQVRLAGADYAFEVKTFEGGSLTLGAKDLQGLQGYHARGVAAYVAVLGDGLLDEWVFARYFPGEILNGKKITPFQLRPYRDPKLERRVKRAFEDAVERYATIAGTERQGGLDRVLSGYPARILA